MHLIPATGKGAAAVRQRWANKESVVFLIPQPPSTSARRRNACHSFSCLLWSPGAASLAFLETWIAGLKK